MIIIEKTTTLSELQELKDLIDEFEKISDRLSEEGEITVNDVLEFCNKFSSIKKYQKKPPTITNKEKVTDDLIKEKFRDKPIIDKENPLKDKIPTSITPPETSKKKKIKHKEDNFTKEQLINSITQKLNSKNDVLKRSKYLLHYIGSGIILKKDLEKKYKEELTGIGKKPRTIDREVNNIQTGLRKLTVMKLIDKNSSETVGQPATYFLTDLGKEMYNILF